MDDHRLVPVPDDDDNIERDESPSKKHKHDDDPDAELDRLIRDNAASSSSEASSLLRSLRDSVGQVGQLAGVVTTLVSRVERSEAQNDSQSARMDRMEQELSRLAALIEEGHQPSARPHHEVSPPKPEKASIRIPGLGTVQILPRHPTWPANQLHAQLEALQDKMTLTTRI